LKTLFFTISSLFLGLARSAAAAQDPAAATAIPPVLLIFPLFLLVAVCWFWLRLQRSKREHQNTLVQFHLAQEALEQAPVEILWFDADFKIIHANQRARLRAGDRPLIGCDLLEIEPTMACHPVVAALQSGQQQDLAAGRANIACPSPGSAGQTVVVLTADNEVPLAVWYRQPMTGDGPESAPTAPIEAIIPPAVESASRMKSEFIANINHEIRTPMNAIIGYTEMLANAELGPREKRFVSIIHKSSMVLVSIFNDIMELSKIDSGRMQIMTSSIRLQSIVDEVEGLFRDTAREKGLRFRCHLSSDLPPIFILDGVRLKQVLQNLVSNAIKFTAKGCVEMEVLGTPSSGQADCYDLHFRVEDSGIGIPTANQEKIFELFQQCEDSISKHYGGVGLGLTLCSRLVAMMGGSIELFSCEGEGARFTVFLPEVRAAVQMQANAKPENGPVYPRREKKILVVDDMDLIKDVFIDYFQDSDFTVLTANTGEEALAIAAAEKPGIIFMDLNLIGMDGRTVTEQLHNQEETATIPVVVMTGEILEEADYKPLFDDFLQKPFRLDALKNIIGRYTRFNQTERAEEQPASFEVPVDREDHHFSRALEAVWTEELEQLRWKATRSGSLSDAVALGAAMLQAGERGQQPLLINLGHELMQYAVEPNILGVDRLLAKLTRTADRNQP